MPPQIPKLRAITPLVTTNDSIATIQVQPSQTATLQATTTRATERPASPAAKAFMATSVGPQASRRHGRSSRVGRAVSRPVCLLDPSDRVRPRLIVVSPVRSAGRSHSEVTMSTTYRAGLVLLGVLSIGDLAAPLLTDGQTPPLSIALIGAGLGLVTLVLIGFAWRGRVAAAVGAVVIRVLSALTAVPAFVFDGVPTVPKVLAGIAITLTVVGSVLVLAGLRRPARVVAA